MAAPEPPRAPPPKFVEELDVLVRARYPLVYLVTSEEQRLEAIPRVRNVNINADGNDSANNYSSRHPYRYRTFGPRGRSSPARLSSPRAG